VPDDADSSQLAAVAVLAEAVRARLYRFVRRRQGPVTREEAADAIGISRALAAFHLDKLVAAGLLTARYDHAPARRRLGRTPKVYEPSDTELAVSVPSRHYELVATFLLEALVTGPSDVLEQALRSAADAARAYGQTLGARARAAARGGRLGAERALTAVEEVLDDLGFEPARPQRDELVPANCPFRGQAQRYGEPVCRLNLALVTGVLDGIGSPSVTMRFLPGQPGCCFALSSAARVR
jgi:predicted ArsR family transcriptional regulator